MNLRDIAQPTMQAPSTPAALALVAPVVIDDAGVTPILDKSRSVVAGLIVTNKPERIENNDVAVSYGETITSLKRERKRLDDQRLSLTKPLRDVIDKINKLAAGPIDQLDIVIEKYSDEVVGWTKRERSRLELERKLAEEQAQRERDRLAAEAEAARKQAEEVKRRADEETARLRRIEDERIEAERQAALAKAEKLKSESARENARIAAENAAAQRQRDADEADAQANADALAQAESLVSYAENTEALAGTIEAKPVYEEPRAKGQSVATTWTAEVTDFSKLPDDYKLPDQKALDALARVRHEKLNIPGVRAVPKMGVRSKI